METVERHQTPRGELVLRRDGERYEIISNGTFLMDTSDGRSERLLVSAALDAAPNARRLLIGGLGVGFSLAQATSAHGLSSITVVEREPAIVEWQHGQLGQFSGHGLADERVRVVVDDLVAWTARTDDRFDAVCLDIDNGPEWTVTAGNAALYSGDGLTALRRIVEPGGVLAVWSSGAAPAFRQRLAATFDRVWQLPVPVRRGEPDLVYLARAAPARGPSGQ